MTTFHNNPTLNLNHLSSFALEKFTFSDSVVIALVAYIRHQTFKRDEIVLESTVGSGRVMTSIFCVFLVINLSCFFLLFFVRYYMVLEVKNNEN